ncbi:hypothetical protein BSKO_09918 [Bryopsis sp. KO-2023]|nr:hypothetical protein BSKO_09918 [Bryopsis sp. KO-2023]
MVTPKPKKKPVKVSTPVCPDDSFHAVPRTPKAVQKEVKVYADSPRAERKSSGTGFDDFACEERRPKRKGKAVFILTRSPHRNMGVVCARLDPAANCDFCRRTVLLDVLGFCGFLANVGSMRFGVRLGAGSRV